jgi:AcrR family transcriptional regulator
MLQASGNKEERDNRIEERRHQILDAATVALARKGFHAATMDDIVAESGLSKGTLYLYFKSKKEILLALCDRFMDAVSLQMTRNMAGKKTLVEQMRGLAEAYVQVCRAEPTDANGNVVNAARLMAEFWQQAVVDPDVRARFVQTYEFYTRMSEEMVKAAIANGEFREVDAATLTRLVMSVFDGLSWRWVLMPEDVDWERSVEVLFDVILKGLRPPS